MSGTLPDGIGQEPVSCTLTRQQWGIVIAALWEAQMPAKLTVPVNTSLQQQLAPKVTVAREETP